MFDRCSLRAKSAEGDVEGPSIGDRNLQSVRLEGIQIGDIVEVGRRLARPSPQPPRRRRVPSRLQRGDDSPPTISCVKSVVRSHYDFDAITLDLSIVVRWCGRSHGLRASVAGADRRRRLVRRPRPVGRQR